MTVEKGCVFQRKRGGVGASDGQRARQTPHSSLSIAAPLLRPPSPPPTRKTAERR